MEGQAQGSPVDDFDVDVHDYDDFDVVDIDDYKNDRRSSGSTLRQK